MTERPVITIVDIFAVSAARNIRIETDLEVCIVQNLHDALSRHILIIFSVFICGDRHDRFRNLTFISKTLKRDVTQLR